MLAFEFSAGEALRDCMREKVGDDVFNTEILVNASVMMGADATRYPIELTWDKGQKRALCQPPPWFTGVPAPSKLETYTFAIRCRDRKAQIVQQGGRDFEGLPFALTPDEQIEKRAADLRAIDGRPTPSAQPTSDRPMTEVEELEHLSKELWRGATQTACIQLGVLEDKHPSSALLGEIKAKRARACIAFRFETGRQQADLRTLAGEGPADYAQALANLTLGEQGELQRYSKALDELEALIPAADARISAEAKSLLLATLRFRLSRTSEPTEAAQLVNRLERLSLSEQDAFDVRLELARIRLWHKESSREGELDLMQLGQISSPQAVRALWELGGYFHSRGDYEQALGLYRTIATKVKETGFHPWFERDLSKRIEEASDHRGIASKH